MKFEKNTELDQANLRIIIASIAMVYMACARRVAGSALRYLSAGGGLHRAVSAGVDCLRQAIARWPGHYPARRIFGMIHDYTGTCFGLVLGGEAALPLYAVIIWVNLGNGMRYGSRYLAIATGLALLALLAVYRLTPCGRRNRTWC
jgi:hypothetical protein